MPPVQSNVTPLSIESHSSTWTFSSVIFVTLVLLAAQTPLSEHTLTFLVTGD